MKVEILIMKKNRQLMTECHGITVTRTDPDSAEFDMNRLINQICTHIIKWNKKQTKVSTKKSLIEDLSKRLLELEFKSKHSIKSKGLKRVVKNILANYRKMNNTKSEIKPIKIGKRLGTTYCLRCKDYMLNFRAEKVKMANKVLREKSHCVVCRSRFLKQKHSNKK